MLFGILVGAIMATFFQYHSVGWDESVEKGRVGTSRDFWLEKRGLLGSWDRVAVYFGFYDDYDGCLETAQALQTINVDARYRCVPAN
jgi:hypothetical protein